MIYLDNAATGVLLPSCLKVMNEEWSSWINANAVYFKAMIASNKIEKIKNEIFEVLNVPVSEYKMVFTSCSSESNSLILSNMNIPVFCKQYEHSSIRNHPNAIQIDFDELEEYLKKGPALISVSLVNHEIGLLLDTKKLNELVKKYNSFLHLDCSQAKNINVRELNADYFTISSHKMGGPVGIAAVLTKFHLKPIIYGGAQEYGIRAGTQSLPLIAGFKEALNHNFSNHFKTLKNHLLNLIDKKYFVEFANFKPSKFYDKFENHIICLITESGSEAVAYMDMNGVLISNSSACKNGINGMQVLKQYSGKGIRVSFGWQNTLEDIEVFASHFNNLVQ